MNRPPSRSPVESIELRLDPAGDAAVRALWQRVADVEVHTLARNDYNAPHVTLAAMSHTDGALAGDRVRSDLAAACSGLVDLRLSLPGVALFPHADSCVLYAAVTPTTALLEAHARVHRVLAKHGLAPYPTSLPDRWNPHCTIAKRVRVAQLGTALEAAAVGTWPIVARVARVIHWDGGDRSLATIA